MYEDLVNFVKRTGTLKELRSIEGFLAEFEELKKTVDSLDLYLNPFLMFISELEELKKTVDSLVKKEENKVE